MADQNCITNDAALNRLQDYIGRLQSVTLDFNEVDRYLQYVETEDSGVTPSSIPMLPHTKEAIVDSVFYDNIRAKLTDIISNLTTVKDDLYFAIEISTEFPIKMGHFNFDSSTDRLTAYDDAGIAFPLFSDNAGGSIVSLGDEFKMQDAEDPENLPYGTVEVDNVDTNGTWIEFTPTSFPNGVSNTQDTRWKMIRRLKQV